MTKSGPLNHMFGKHLSEEMKKRLSISHRECWLTKAELEKLYWIDGLSTSQIGAVTSFNPETIRKRMIELEIKRRQPSQGMTGKEMPSDVRKAKSLRLRGEKSHLWKGGITKGNLVTRNRIDAQLWKEAVLKRDQYKCQGSGELHTNKLHVHHIKNFIVFPELRFVVDNGLTLCWKCHALTLDYGVKHNRNWEGKCIKFA